jgi:hypothetical protein
MITVKAAADMAAALKKLRPGDNDVAIDSRF